MAGDNVLNTVIMNEFTDGVSYEKKWNYTLFVDNLRGETSQLSLPDTNHNVKILKYQLIGGSSPVSFGIYI